MTVIDVQNIVRAEIRGFKELISITPELTTKQACKMLGCERHWLSKNKHLFGGYVVNKRGDLKFPTNKILEYKQNKN